MKRLLLTAATVLSVAAPTAALADHDRRGGYDDRYYGERYERAYGHDRYERRAERAWRRNDYLPYGLRRGHWIDPRAWGLHRPRDRNLAWFRVGDQLILANIHNGLVAEAHWR